MTVEELKVLIKPLMGERVWRGYQGRHDFPNGYGFSVIQGPYTYGGPDGLYELAVIHNGSLCYTSPITDDVMGYLTLPECVAIIERIEALPKTEICSHHVHEDE